MSLNEYHRDEKIIHAEQYADAPEAHQVKRRADLKYTFSVLLPKNAQLDSFQDYTVSEKSDEYSQESGENEHDANQLQQLA